MHLESITRSIAGSSLGSCNAKRSLAAALCLFVLGACQNSVIDVDPQPDTAGLVSIDNGRQVFWAGGCASCHASIKQESTNTLALGGGRTLQTSFGVFYVPNISPDADTGIGAWTRSDFIRALRRGRAPDGRTYYPAFPYPSYARMSDRDIVDLFAFLVTLPPVTNSVENNQLVFPVNQPIAPRLWQQLYQRPGPVVELTRATPTVARGQYLVEGPGHCGSCHTPRTALGGPRRSLWLGGAEMPDQTGFAPNLTPHNDGLGDWSEAEIVEALRPTGPTDDADTGMNAVRANLVHLPESDLLAIAAYLKAVPPVAPIPSH